MNEILLRITWILMGIQWACATPWGARVMSQSFKEEQLLCEWSMLNCDSCIQWCWGSDTVCIYSYCRFELSTLHYMLIFSRCNLSGKKKHWFSSVWQLTYFHLSICLEIMESPSITSVSLCLGLDPCVDKRVDTFIVSTATVTRVWGGKCTNITLRVAFSSRSQGHRIWLNWSFNSNKTLSI